MKLSHLTAGNSYFISDDKNWLNNANGRNGTFTGRNEGFRAEFEFEIPGLNGTKVTELVSLPNVRETTVAADVLLFDIRETENRRRAVDAKLRRMTEKVGGDPNGLLSTNNAPERESEFTVTLDKESFVALLKLAHKGLNA